MRILFPFVLRRSDPQAIRRIRRERIAFVYCCHFGFARFSRQSGAIVSRSAVPNGRLCGRVAVVIVAAPKQQQTPAQSGNEWIGSNRPMTIGSRQSEQVQNRQGACCLCA